MTEKTPHQIVAEHVLATSDNQKLRISIVSNPEGVLAWIKFNLNIWINLIKLSTGVDILFTQDLNTDSGVILDELRKSLEIPQV